MERALKARPEADLYEAHRSELVRFASVLVGPDDAPDIVSDAMVSLLRNGQLAEATHPSALMHRAVLSKARSMQRSLFRRRARERRFAQRAIEEQPDFRPEVIAAVIGLSPQQRACVYFAYWRDLTPSLIADQLGIGEGTVKRYLARARANLREALDE